MSLTLPTLVKTWTHSFNASFAAGSAAATNQALLLAISNGLLGMSTNPATCYYSCNSLIAGAAADGVNRWATAGNIVGGTGAAVRSWTVLYFSALGLYMMISVGGASSITVTISKNAYTGGSTTTDPTAVNSRALVTNSAYGMNASNLTHRLHIQYTTDGLSVRVIICNSGFATGILSFDTPTDKVDGTIGMLVVCFAGAQAAGTVYNTTNMCNPTGATFVHLLNNGTWYQACLTCEGFSTATLIDTVSVGGLANEISAGWPALKMGVCGVSPGVRNLVARITDWFWVSAAIGTGNTAPASGGVQFTVLGQIIIPANVAAALT